MVDLQQSPGTTAPTASTAPTAAAQPRPPTRLRRALRIAAHYVLFALAGAGAWATPIDPRLSAYLMRAKPWTDTGE